ncbi:MAG: O-antigen ligase family protein [Thiothrix sp.]
MHVIRSAAVFFMLLLVFALPTDGAVEVAGMSLVKIAGLMAFGLTAILLLMGNGIQVSARFHSAVLVYVAWVMLSYTWSAMPEPYETTQAVSSEQALKSHLYILVVSFLLFQLITNPLDLVKLSLVLVFGSFWLVYLMVKDYQITVDTVRHHIKQFDANEVSVKLAMVMPLAVYLVTQVSQRWMRLVGLLYIPAAVFTILITGSRTGAMVMVLGLAGFLPTILRTGLLGKAASVLILVVGVIAATHVIPEKTIERIFSTGKEISSGTLNERSVIWAHAYEEWEQSPLYGHGLGSFRRIINPHNVDYTAHNSFVAIAAEQGVIGGMLYCGVIALVALAAWRVGGDERWLLLLMLLIVVIGQMSLTLQDRLYLWFAYTLIVLTLHIKDKVARPA